MTLRVTFEIVPFGEEANKHEIHEVNISNLGMTPSGNYKYGIEVNKYKTDEYDGYVYHNRDDGPFKLVEKVMGTLT